MLEIFAEEIIEVSGVSKQAFLGCWARNQVKVTEILLKR